MDRGKQVAAFEVCRIARGQEPSKRGQGTSWQGLSIDHWKFYRPDGQLAWGESLLAPLARDGHAKDRPNSVTIAHLAWRAAGPVQPLCKIHQLNRVFDANVGD